MRVYELAKELNVSNKELLDLLKKLGIIVKSRSSRLEESEIEKVKNYKTSSTKSDYFGIKLKQDVVKRIPVKDRITTLNESIKYNPMDSRLYYRRGILYACLGKTTDALHDYNRSLKIDSQFAKAYYARAELYIALNNKQLAMKDLEKALELESFAVMAALQKESKKDDSDLKLGILEDNNASKLLHSSDDLKHYLFKLAEEYIDSGNDLVPFLDLIGVDKSEYDFDCHNIEPEDLVSVIMEIIDYRSCCDQLIDFINTKKEHDEYGLWNLFL